jgi:alginate O-acetyltransferase complex protein AlgJ
VLGMPAPTPEAAGAVIGDLRCEDIQAVFREFLGRVATAGDIATWMQAGSLRALIDGVIDSEEYQQRLHARALGERVPSTGPFLNCWIEGKECYARPAGEVSPDEVAIVGEQGHLFIYGGSNDNVVSHRGEIVMAAGWMDSWRELVTQRFEQADRAGRRLACMVVPEKLAVYGDLFPQDLTPRAPRPVLSLLEGAELPLVYPQDALRDAREVGETYLRTDSHLTVAGNRLLAGEVMRRLGLPTTLLPALEYAPPYLAAGDLGSHFAPPMLEVMTLIGTPSRATVTSDNWPQVAAVKGHIGTIRVFRNNGAPDDRTAVVFGDSYGFGDDAYQGLSWFLAQVFREVHFLWVPFGWDPEYLDSVEADVVVCQTAERFIGRMPNARVDARSLARETVARRTPLTDGRIFRDRPIAG